jgi:hypothetical protein
MKTSPNRSIAKTLGAPASRRRDRASSEPYHHLVGMARCAVPARVQRAEQMLEHTRITFCEPPLNAARTAQRAIPTHLNPVHETLITSGIT